MDFRKHRRDSHGLGRLQAYLRQITYGGNDGIVTTFAVVAGFAGASADGTAEVGAIAVVLFGLANLFADATSMGLGEFLSSRAEGDVYTATRQAELKRLVTEPDLERQEMHAMLTARGLDAPSAAELSATIIRYPELSADLMMTYEFEMKAPDGHEAVTNALFTFFSFLAFGSIPLLPYFLLPPEPRTFKLSVAATFLALVILGTLRWRATLLPLQRAVGETVLVGGTCAGVAYLVGWIIGG